MTIKFDKKLDPTRLSRSLSKKYKLVPYLDKAFETFDGPFEMKMGPKGSDDAWHPSGHCMPSPSALYRYVTEDIDPTGFGKTSGSLRKSFMVGHFWHALLQQLVLEMGFCGPEDIERKGIYTWHDRHIPYHWATGAGDIAPCHIPRHGEYVIDFKTMASQQYKVAGIPEWAAAKYECQINIYMSFFQIEKALIVAINKDTPHDFKEFEYVYNPALATAIFDKWRFVGECVTNEMEPTVLDDDEFETRIKMALTGPIA